jgi:hypothetical protein
MAVRLYRQEFYGEPGHVAQCPARGAIGRSQAADIRLACAEPPKKKSDEIQ